MTHTSTEQPEALRLAYEIGANRIKVQPKEAERLRFEQWMAGHCWKVCGTWDGTTYRGAAENGDYLDPQAMHTRYLFAAWRDCAALRDHLEASRRASVAQDAPPVAYLWQHTITGQKKALMSDDVFTAGPHWRLVGPLRLATESGPGVHMATASVPGAATHWRKAQALPELTAHQPPVVNDSFTTESTVNQKVTVQVPPFTHTALHKLDDLLTQGFRITGYSIERADIADWAPQRGFVTHGGLVGWWTPHQIDRIPGAQHGQPT